MNEPINKDVLTGLKEIIKPELRISQEKERKIKDRDSKYKAADVSCVKAIAQAAINVELFTIPLYMTGLYSIYGMHQIGDDSGLYPGRWWPGLAATAGFIPDNSDRKDEEYYSKNLPPLEHELSVNEQVFNGVYSVFVEEMLHLQLASNMASKLGFTPRFTSPALINEQYGWHCYDNQPMIPHILDFRDCDSDLNKLSPQVRDYFKAHFKGKSLQDLRVNATELSKEQALLFLLIEETEEDAQKIIAPEYLKPGKDGRPKYFESAPFDWWTPDNTETDLPLFGSIGHMYLCYWNYLQIKYNDGTYLLDELAEPVQRDYFNKRPGDSGYQKQYPGIKGSLNSALAEGTHHFELKLKLINNINAITDQGEGQGVVELICQQWSHESWAQEMLRELFKEKKQEPHTVKPKFQPKESALEHDYPGDPISGSACARIMNKENDHFKIFKQTLELIVQFSEPCYEGKDRYSTWKDWHCEGNRWNKDMLNPGDSDEAKNAHPDLPGVDEITAALNNLSRTEKSLKETHQLFSQSAVGTIKGLTTALDRYWSGQTNEFPGPAMGGSGDRVSICWATTGRAPDLVTGIAPQEDGVLYHACQGMSYTEDNVGLPPAQVFHSCKGSNDCKAQGGCGFVHSTTPGGSCGSSSATGIKSAPADNKCNNLGGCAVPISASQLFPSQPEEHPKMQLFSFYGKENHFKPISYATPDKRDSQQGCASSDETTPMPYKEGDAVYKIAWQAYCNANGLVDKQTGTIPEPPEVDDIRLALPPST
ncbi:ferritin-like protein [Pseudoalteromonas sp. DL2-H2.2]|uniref:ferritin-like protein n=1 Tax=Pseudoalteromonas sp. DL2-H2.2 TaxID=2908889 RepID=UPI001F34EDA4|nr:ferritin-like protein [Pseudoalteromonas sp. DL2-H2.2]MCF2906958.1 ferritin-like protein [Pseudoalteromonas sp. DL2-H2.2]